MNITNKTKTVLIAAIMLIAAFGGTWLLTAPSRERKAIESGQEALLQYILAEIAEIAENSDTPQMLDYFFEPLPYVLDVQNTPQTYWHDEEMTAVYEPFEEYVNNVTETNEETITNEETLTNNESEHLTFVPLPQSAFPLSIQGIGILTIERIDLRLPVADGVEYETLRIAPGRVPQTAQVGDIGNAVIAGHRNYTFGSMFNRFGELEIGDVIGFTAINGEEMTFVVFEIAIIEPQDQIAFIQPINDSIITLYTCEPVRTASHRLIIRAQRV